MFKWVNKTLLSHYGKSPVSSRQIPLTLQTVTVAESEKLQKAQCSCLLCTGRAHTDSLATQSPARFMRTHTEFGLLIAKIYSMISLSSQHQEEC